MHRFWNAYIGPLMQAVHPRRVLEIGAEFGWNTRHVLAYCRDSGARLEIVDPVPLPSLQDLLAAHPDVAVALHARKSLEVIGDLEPFDFVLLDGDHNWRTVYAELNQIYAAADRARLAPPVIVAHDCAWPYARRDMYYDPEDWREVERQPYAYRAIRPGERELVDEGLNARLANALVEGGPENGVLTAVEDFVASRGGVELRVLPFHNGLGVLVPQERRTPEVDATVDGFFSSDSLLEACRRLEEDGMKVRVELGTAERRLTRRTEALERARGMLQERATRIADLEAEVARLTPQAAG